MRAALVLFALGLFTSAVSAGSAFDSLGGEDIRKAFEGNTVSGRYTNGGLFTEYHDLSGRALGHNGYEKNRDACWAIVADAVCYYYGPPKQRTTHCFTVTRNDKLYLLRVVGSDRLNAVATIETGNPRHHSDEGAPWICDGLVSQAQGMSPRLAAAALPSPRGAAGRVASAASRVGGDLDATPFPATPDPTPPRAGGGG